jgi:hypothetical protein
MTFPVFYSLAENKKQRKEQEIYPMRRLIPSKITSIMPIPPYLKTNIYYVIKYLCG